MSFLIRNKSILDLLEGEFVSTGKYFDPVSSNGGEVTVVIENDNGFPVFIPNLVVRSNFAGRIEKGFNPDVTTEASNLELVNKKSDGSVNQDAVNVFTAGDGQPGEIDTTNADKFNPKRILAGDAISPGAESDIGGNIIASGDKMYVTAVNTSSSDEIVSIDLDYIRLRDKL